MARTVKEKIKAKIRVAPRGKLFLLSDFEELGEYPSIRKSLSELVKEGVLFRVVKGIYQKPKYNETLKLHLLPTIEQVAQVFARKNNWQIAPAKDLALNMLAIDTQVPNVVHFISSGPTKKITLDDGREIHFRHVTAREASMDATSALVIEAFKQLGEKGVDDKVLSIVASKLSPEQMKQLDRDSKYSRVWIKEKIQQMREASK